MRLKEKDVFFCGIAGKRIHGGVQPAQTASFRFFQPLVSIIVPVEYDPFMVMNRTDNQVMKRSPEILGLFKFVSKLPQAFRNDRIQDDIRI